MPLSELKSLEIDFENNVCRINGENLSLSDSLSLSLNRGRIVGFYEDRVHKPSFLFSDFKPTLIRGIDLDRTLEDIRRERMRYL